MESSYIKLPPKIIEALETRPLFRDLLVVSSGYRKGDSKIGMLTHKEASKNCFLHYCISGEGWIEVEGERKPICPGDLLICRSGIEHTYGAVKENPWETQWVYFSGSLAESYIDLIDDTEGKKLIVRQAKAHSLRGLNSIISLMEKGYAQVYMLHASNILKSLLTAISYQNDSEDTLDHRLENLIGHMMSNLDSTMTLKEMAESMAMSRDYFSKVFYRKYGYTPVDYFIRLKIQESCRLLSTSDLSISEVGEMVGYEDGLYFSRIFKKKSGMSPTAYRKATCG